METKKPRFDWTQRLESGIGWIKRKLPYLLAVLFPLAGAITAYSLFHELDRIADGDKPGDKTQSAAKRDTIYVNVVNGGILAANTTIRDSAGTKKQGGSSSNVQGGDRVNIGGAGNQATEPRVPAAKVDSKTLTATALQQVEGNGVPLSLWILGLFSLTALGLFVGFKQLPFLQYDINKDRDPASLTHVFNLNREAIRGLGNPRKIKRFSNKVRFQYHYLKQIELMEDNDLSKLVTALIKMEKNEPWEQEFNGAKPDLLPAVKSLNKT